MLYFLFSGFSLRFQWELRHERCNKRTTSSEQDFSKKEKEYSKNHKCIFLLGDPGARIVWLVQRCYERSGWTWSTGNAKCPVFQLICCLLLYLEIFSIIFRESSRCIITWLAFMRKGMHVQLSLPWSRRLTMLRTGLILYQAPGWATSCLPNYIFWFNSVFKAEMELLIIT